MKKISGSCYCQSIQFEVDGPLRDVIACHFTQCRKISGHYVAATSVHSNHLKLSESSTLQWYRASATAERGFCSCCGSSLFWKPEGGDRVSIFAGVLDGETGLSITSHLFVENKGDYYEINDGADQLVGYGRETLIQ